MTPVVMPLGGSPPTVRPCTIAPSREQEGGPPTSLSQAYLDQQWQQRKAEETRVLAGITLCGRSQKWGYRERSVPRFILKR